VSASFLCRWFWGRGGGIEVGDTANWLVWPAREVVMSTAITMAGTSVYLYVGPFSFFLFREPRFPFV